MKTINTLNIIAGKQTEVLNELYKGHEILSTGNRGMKILCYDWHQLPFWITISYNHDLTNYTYYEAFTKDSEDIMMLEKFSTFEELLNHIK
tara:strand:- start:25 stop:297 length:273 start_codon:yes stop_codon:yes gene_type:complete